MSRKYNHVEAFCRMRYRSESGREIRIWNSRDGVTPFTVSIDEENFTHVAFRDDKCEPDRVPRVGEWIFVDMTLERATHIYTGYVDRMWDYSDAPMHDIGRWASKHDAVIHLAETMMAYGAPDKLKVSADLLSGFLAGRTNRA